MSENRHSLGKDKLFPLRFNNGFFRIPAISELRGVVNYDRRLTLDIGAFPDGVKPDLPPLHKRQQRNVYGNKTHL
ncbi:MAG: hypothetical protein J1E34_03120 [Oscillospiraceae bacterium]|nr:hypothetical protein [Oscillospiraceae bacterium]